MSAFKDRIRANIAAHGHHITVVAGERTPRWAYTIGLTRDGLPELVLAGAATLSVHEVGAALNAAAVALRAGTATGLRSVHDTWARELLLGAFDLCGDGVTALQLAPGHTIDVPDLSQPWDAEREPVWRWLREPWPYAIPADAIAVTDLAVLHGAPVLRGIRWEEHWQLFSRPSAEIRDDELARVRLSLLLGHDASLAPFTTLAVDDGLIREPGGPWRAWS